MPAVIVTPLAGILTWATGQLVSVTGLPVGRVFLSLRENPPHFQNDQDLIVRPLDPVPDENYSEGAGRWCVVVVRPLLVTVRSRMLADLYDQDGLGLTDPVRGHLALEELVLNALHGILPTDGNGNALCIQPLHFAPSLRPDKAPNDGPDWIQSRLAFEMRYQANVTTSPAV